MAYASSQTHESYVHYRIVLGRYGSLARWHPANPVGRVRYRGVNRHEETNSSGCSFAASIDNVNLDVAAIPEADVFGNDTDNGYMAVTRYSSGSYNGLIQPTYQNVINASFNASGDAARRARTSATLPATFFVVGLGGASDAAPDEFLRRIANDPSALNYSATQPVGLYIYSPGPSDLQAAFVYRSRTQHPPRGTLFRIFSGTGVPPPYHYPRLHHRTHRTPAKMMRKLPVVAHFEYH